MKAFYASLEHDSHFKREQFRATVGGKLAGIVYSAGRTAAAIAKRCGMKPSQLSRQLSGDVNLTLDTIYRIAQAAGAEVEVSFAPKAMSFDVPELNLSEHWTVEIPEASLEAEDNALKILSNFADLTKAAGELLASTAEDNKWDFTFVDSSRAANDHQFTMGAEA